MLRVISKNTMQQGIMNTITEGSERIESSLDHSDNRVKKSSKSKSSRKEKHSRHRHKDTHSTDVKGLQESFIQKIQEEKEKEENQGEAVLLRSQSSDVVIDGSISEDSQEDIIIKAEVSLPSSRQLTAGISMSDDSYSESSPSDDSDTDEDLKNSVSSSRSSNRQSSSRRTRSSRSGSGRTSDKPRAKDRSAGTRRN